MRAFHMGACERGEAGGGRSGWRAAAPEGGGGARPPPPPRSLPRPLPPPHSSIRPLSSVVRARRPPPPAPCRSPPPSLFKNGAAGSPQPPAGGGPRPAGVRGGLGRPRGPGRPGQRRRHQGRQGRPADRLRRGRGRHPAQGHHPVWHADGHGGAFLEAGEEAEGGREGGATNKRTARRESSPSVFRTPGPSCKRGPAAAGGDVPCSSCAVRPPDQAHATAPLRTVLQTRVHVLHAGWTGQGGGGVGALCARAMSPRPSRAAGALLALAPVARRAPPPLSLTPSPLSFFPFSSSAPKSWSGMAMATAWTWWTARR